MSAASKQLQISHATSFMRYRDYYTRIRANLLRQPSPRILIFGCSTGEELKTVHHFWPEAEIYGCDIDDDVLATATREAPFATVFKSTEDAIRDFGPFDLVCANSVLCRHPFPKETYADELSFATFEAFVVQLLSVLKGGGYLFAYNTNYFLQDLDIGAHLQPIVTPEAWSGGFVPRVDSSGAVVAHPTVLDQVLRRYVVSGEVRPLDLMRTALFRLGRGPEVTVTDHIALPATSLPPVEVNLPEPTHGKAFEPCFIDTQTGTGTLRTTYLHDPVERAWVLHGTHMVYEGD